MTGWGQRGSGAEGEKERGERWGGAGHAFFAELLKNLRRGAMRGANLLYHRNSSLCVRAGQSVPKRVVIGVRGRECEGESEGE